MIQPVSLILRENPMEYVLEEVIVHFVEGVLIDEALQIVDDLKGIEISADALKGYVRARVKVPANEETAWAKRASLHPRVRETQLNHLISFPPKS